MRVLLGEISSYKAIVIARYINERYPAIELLAYDNKSLVCSIHSKYVKQCVYIPNTSIDEYVVKLAECVREKQIDVFIPVHSDYIGHVLQRKELFGTSLDYLGQYADYIQLHEKDQLMQLARSLKIRVPNDYTSIDAAEVPFVLKPTNLSSAKGVRYYRSKDEKNTISSIPTGMICQEYIRGKGCGYEVYCQNGKILSEYGHLRLAEWPVSGGSSVLRTGYIHHDMRPIAEKILHKVQWTGFVMFEFKLTDDNQLVLIEANPRIWGSINQALQNDCPLFAAILGDPIELSYREDRRTCLMPQVWLSLLCYMCKGNISVLRDYMKYYRNTYSDVNVWHDPKGVLSMLIRKIV